MERVTYTATPMGVSVAQDKPYATWETGWTPRPCPQCGVEATARAVLSWDPPPAPPALDQRKAFAHVYAHAGADADYCVVPESEDP